jgi:hypothetical protein
MFCVSAPQLNDVMSSATSLSAEIEISGVATIFKAAHRSRIVIQLGMWDHVSSASRQTTNASPSDRLCERLQVSVVPNSGCQG